MENGKTLRQTSTYENSLTSMQGCSPTSLHGWRIPGRDNQYLTACKRAPFSCGRRICGCSISPQLRKRQQRACQRAMCDLFAPTGDNKSDCGLRGNREISIFWRTDKADWRRAYTLTVLQVTFLLRKFLIIYWMNGEQATVIMMAAAVAANPDKQMNLSICAAIIATKRGHVSHLQCKWIRPWNGNTFRGDA